MRKVTLLACGLMLALPNPVRVPLLLPPQVWATTTILRNNC